MSFYHSNHKIIFQCPESVFHSKRQRRHIFGVKVSSPSPSSHAYLPALGLPGRHERSPPCSLHGMGEAARWLGHPTVQFGEMLLRSRRWLCQDFFAPSILDQAGLRTQFLCNGAMWPPITRPSQSITVRWEVAETFYSCPSPLKNKPLKINSWKC